MQLLHLLLRCASVGRGVRRSARGRAGGFPRGRRRNTVRRMRELPRQVSVRGAVPRRRAVPRKSKAVPGLRAVRHGVHGIRPGASAAGRRGRVTTAGVQEGLVDPAGTGTWHLVDRTTVVPRLRRYRPTPHCGCRASPVGPQPSTLTITITITSTNTSTIGCSPPITETCVAVLGLRILCAYEL
jgi:hypothetical protein